MRVNNISVSFRYSIASSDVPESVNASVAVQVATFFNNRSSHFAIQHQTAKHDGLDLRFLVRMKDKCDPKNARETLMRNLVNHAHAAKENMKCMVRACTNLETQYLDSDDTCTNLVWTCTCSSAQAANLLPNEATQATAAVKDSGPASAQADTTFVSASPSKCFGAPGGESRQAELPPQYRNDSAAAGAIHRPAMVFQRFCLICALTGEFQTSSELGRKMQQRTVGTTISASAGAHKIRILLKGGKGWSNTNVSSQNSLRDRLVHGIQKLAHEGTIDVWLSQSDSSEPEILEVRIACVWKFQMYNHTVRRFLHNMINAKCTVNVFGSDRNAVRDTYLKPPGPGGNRWLQYSGLRGTFYEMPLRDFVRVLGEIVRREEARFLSCESREEFSGDARSKQVLLYEICNVLEWHTKNNTPVQPRSIQSLEHIIPSQVGSVMGDPAAAVNAVVNDTANLSHITPAAPRQCSESGADSSKAVKQRLNFSDTPARPEGARESVNLQDRSILSGGNYVPMDVPPY